MRDTLKNGTALALGGLVGISLSECAKESGFPPILVDPAIMLAGWLIAQRWTFFGLGMVGIAAGRFILQIVEREEESAFRCPIKLVLDLAKWRGSP